jgi:hypothetical protein
MIEFTMEKFNKICNEVIKFHDENINVIRLDSDPQRKQIMALNHDKNYFSFHSIKYLSNLGRVPDVYILSRAMFESIVNMGLIAKKLVNDDLERYIRFQYVENYKLYKHLNNIDFGHMLELTQEEALKLEQFNAEYISKFGKIKNWSGNNLAQNVKLLDINYSSTCNESHFYEYLYCQVYRSGSEYIHASYFGLEKGVDAIEISKSYEGTNYTYETKSENLIFSCYHSLLVFLSSIRFLGIIMGRQDIEDYYHEICNKYFFGSLYTD